MKAKRVITIILICIFLIGVTSLGFYLFFIINPSKNRVVSVSSDDKLFGWKYPVVKFPSTGSNPNLIAYSSVRDPGGVTQGLPVRLFIPVIGVNSIIEDALITPDGRMDVPLGSRNVAWFSLGPYPGKEGSAVIGGHFGINNGIPFVFYNLDKLKIGDKIYIKDDEDKTLVFVVRSISSFDRDADAKSVFTSNDGKAHLNLITCEGVWNQVNNTYPQRLVVFTDAIPTEPMADDTKKTVAHFPRTFGMGAQGADVEALQTALEQRGFLTMPIGVSKGYFGSLTRAGLIEYQTSVGISPIGYFGPLTRAKLIAELGIAPALPNAGAEALARPSELPATPSAAQVLIQYVAKHLYGTPVDGLVTSILLVFIAAVTVIIIRL